MSLRPSRSFIRPISTNKWCAISASQLPDDRANDDDDGPASVSASILMSTLWRWASRSVSRVSSPPRVALRLGVFVLAWFPAFIYFNDHVAQIMWVGGPSMTPFLNTHFHASTQRSVILASMSKPYQNLHRGSVIAFYAPHDPNKMAIKRIVALEGDVVETKGGYPYKTQVVPQGHVWVEGDNLEARYSYDSNSYGPIAMSLITAKVVAAIWPSWAWIRWQDWQGSPRVKEGKLVHRAELWTR